jgi:hypothetical protein
MTAKVTALANSFKGRVRQKGQRFARLEGAKRNTSENEGDEQCQCNLKRSALYPKKPPEWREQPNRKGMATCAMNWAVFTKIRWVLPYFHGEDKQPKLPGDELW